MKNKGGALVIALIIALLVAVISAATLSMMGSNNQFEAQKQNSLQLNSALDEALQVAINDLSFRAKNNDWLTFEHGSTVLSVQGRVDMGILPESDLYSRTVIRPRFEKNKQDGTQIKIYYFAQSNIDLNDSEAFAVSSPKMFDIVVESNRQGQGSIETLQAKLEIAAKGLGSYALAFIDNVTYKYQGQINPKDDVALSEPPYNMIPMRVKGDAFLGHVHPLNYHWANSINDPNYNSHDVFGDPEWNAYVFEGRLETGQEAEVNGDFFSVGTDVAFRADVFEASVDVSYAMNDDSGLSEWLQEQEDTADETFFGVNEHYCLKAESDVLSLWECNIDSQIPSQRYVGEFSQKPLETWTLDGDALKMYFEGQVHLKGLVSGKLRIVANNGFWIEGDIQYEDQSEASIDEVVVFTQKNINIPSTIPNYAKAYYDNAPRPKLTDIEDITNITVLNDRDINDSNYYALDNCIGACLNPIQGSANAFGTLDVDGVYTSMGTLKMAPFDQAFNEQSIFDYMGGVWNQYLTIDPKYYYDVDFKGRRIHKEDPLICASAFTEPDKCAVNNELKRHKSYAFWLFGSLILGQPPERMNVSIGEGFQKMHLTADERFDDQSGFALPGLNGSNVRLVQSKKTNKKLNLSDYLSQ